MPKTHNKTGRSNGNGRFVALPHSIMQTLAWSRLSSHAKVAWLEFVRLYKGRGSNNGTLAMSSRILGERLNISKSRAAMAINQLITFGFLEPTTRASFSGKRRAAEYLLTHLPDDRTGELPKKTYLRLLNGCAAADNAKQSSSNTVSSLRDMIGPPAGQGLSSPDR
jgi:hypothetical protein